jgi:hypothetical protein
MASPPPPPKKGRKYRAGGGGKGRGQIQHPFNLKIRGERRMGSKNRRISSKFYNNFTLTNLPSKTQSSPTAVSAFRKVFFISSSSNY